MEHGILKKETLAEMADIFKLLSHPSRLCIMVNLMAVGESNVSNMQNCLCEPQSTVSQHRSRERDWERKLYIEYQMKR